MCPTYTHTVCVNTVTHNYTTRGRGKGEPLPSSLAPNTSHTQPYTHTHTHTLTHTQHVPSTHTRTHTHTHTYTQHVPSTQTHAHTLQLSHPVATTDGRSENLLIRFVFVQEHQVASRASWYNCIICLGYIEHR